MCLRSVTSHRSTAPGDVKPEREGAVQERKPPVGKCRCRQESGLGKH